MPLSPHGATVVTMATRVEVSTITSLTAVPGLGDIGKEESLKRAYFRQAAADPSGVASARGLETKGILRSPGPLFPLPRLTPKPFSKEQAPEGKPPARFSEEVVATKVSSVVTLEAGSVFSRASFLSPSPGAMTLLESTQASPAPGNGVGHRPHETPPGSRPEVAAKPAVPARKPVVPLPRPATLLQDTRSPVAAEGPGPEQPRLKASIMEDTAGPIPEPKPRLKQRPVSAIFIEALQPQRPGPGGLAAVGKTPPTPPEKTWERRPRPLSMDLTARFENREALLRKVTEEGHGGAAGPSTERRAPERPSPEPKGDGECVVQAEAPGHEPGSDFLEVTRKFRDRQEKLLVKQVEPGSPRSPGGLARVIPRDEPYPWEEKAWQDGEEPEKTPPSPLPKLGKVAELAEVKSRSADGETGSTGATWVSRGSVRKRLSLFGEDSALALPARPASPLATPESPSPAPEPEKGSPSVQERIKGWAVESPEVKPEFRRRTFQARPLSADLTKLFSSSASSQEVRYEKISEPSGELPKERKEKPKEGHGLDGVPAPRSPWKPATLRDRPGQMERKDSSNQEPDCGTKPSEVTPEDDRSFQTVWATVFEHHVERHSVAVAVADPSGRCLSATPPRDVEPRPRPEREPRLGKDPLEVANLRKSSRWPGTPEKLEQSAPVDGEPRRGSPQSPEGCPWGEKRNSTPFLQHSGSPPAAQRVEPKFDVLVHTVAERVHSEAISTVPEVPALTLRSHKSRLSLSQEGSTAPTSPGGQLGSVQRASLIWEARGTQEANGPKDASGGPRSPSPKWTAGKTLSRYKATMVGSEEPGTPEATSTSVIKAAVQESPQQCPGGTGTSPGGCVSMAEKDQLRGGALEPSVKAKIEASSWTAPSDFMQRRFVGLATSEGETSLAKVPEPEVKLRKAGPTDARVDRWRRRTLPHDVKFDTFSFLPAENWQKAERRRIMGDATLDTPQLSHPGVQTQVGSPGGPRMKHGSPEEPKATFFAVTYQIPDIQKAKSVVKPATEHVLEASRKTPPPLSPRPLVSLGHEEPPPETAGSKSWAEGREREDLVSVAKILGPTEHPAPVGDRLPDPSSERIIDVDALQIQRGAHRDTGFHGDWKDSGSQGYPSGSGPQAISTLKSQPRTRESQVRRRTEVISDTFPGKVRDGYRSSVLDLDSLMAEYREQASKVSGQAQEPKRGSAWERPGQPAGPEWKRRSLKDAPKMEGTWKDVSVMDVNHAYTPSLGRQPTEATAASPSTKPSSPLWALPYPAPPERQPGVPSVSEGPKNKVSGITEEEKQTSVRKHSALGQNFSVEPKTSGREDLGSSKAKGSPRSSDAEKKGAPKKATRQVEEEEEGRVAQLGARLTSPVVVKRASSEKGRPVSLLEGLSVMKEAHERRQEQVQGKASLATESLETKVGPGRWESRPRDGHKVPPRDPEKGAELLPRQVSPTSPGPRRSRSFHRDKRSGPFVDQLKQCFSRRTGEAKDTDTLVQEADSQYGTWTDQRQCRDGLAPESPSPDGGTTTATWKPSPRGRLSSSSSSQPEATLTAGQQEPSTEQRSAGGDRSSADLDSTDGTEGPPTPDAGPARGTDHFAFINQTSILDSSALKTRVQLSKRCRRRAPLSHNLRRSQFSQSESCSPLEEETDNVWMFKDSTEEKSPRREEESDEEEKLPRAERTPISRPQRMPVFPGMDPAVLKAQLQKRPEVSDGPGETSSWAPQPKTPKSPFQPGVLGSRVLPPSMEQEDRSVEPSPQWLKELKSRKRQSLYENQA
ncbi:uncharacterized protein KIAA1671 homolog isoform X2 [Ochotona princeps]|uniref:uncharacterized protein KIAA1671 homolog isoform X2 n=1 Tax=Ochotona princeps TaxID=9978 RepID=UPI0027149C85|nr:uncharacterized protein KIAA1671 homolog isoform X2 [Ochotona princeps]